MATTAKKKKTSKLCIKLKAYDARLLDKATREIVDTVQRTGSVISGPIPLPTKINKFTVLRSTHVNKTAREQFEIREHRRLINISDHTPATIDGLKRLNVAAGVDIEIGTK